MLAHFEMSQIPPVAERRDVMKRLEGVFLNGPIDSKFGASHHRMAFIEYQPGVGIRPHDRTFEESDFVLSGDIEGVLDGEPVSEACTRFKTRAQHQYDGLKRARLNQLRRMHFDIWRSGRSVQWRLKVS